MNFSTTQKWYKKNHSNSKHNENSKMGMASGGVNGLGNNSPMAANLSLIMGHKYNYNNLEEQEFDDDFEEDHE